MRRVYRLIENNILSAFIPPFDFQGDGAGKNSKRGRAFPKIKLPNVGQQQQSSDNLFIYLFI